jgi:hypothetical protein
MSAVVFIFIYINPFSSIKEKNNDVEKVTDRILANITYKIGKLSFITFIGDPQGPAHNFKYYFNPVDYSANSFAEVKYIDNTPNNISYYVYMSKESNIFDYNNPPFPPNYCHASGSSCDVSMIRYITGAYNEEDMIVHEKIVKLKNYYQSDYNSLKSSLKINKDFSFNITDTSGKNIDSLSIQKIIPKGINVETKEFPIRTIDKTGNMHEFIINIKAW